MCLYPISKLAHLAVGMIAFLILAYMLRWELSQLYEKLLVMLSKVINKIFKVKVNEDGYIQHLHYVHKIMYLRE